MTLNRTFQAHRSRAWPGFRALLASMGCLAFAWGATAQTTQVTVKTIGGGVRAECGSAAGFVAGNTYDVAQYNSPYATALDSQGNLWLADLKNSDLEVISAAGSTSSSTTTHFGTYLSGVTNYHWFTNINAVAVDPSGDVYALLPQNGAVPNTVIKYQVAGQFINPLAYAQFATPGGSATAMLVDLNSNVYVSFTNGSSGIIIRFTLPDAATSAAFSNIVTAFSWEPAGLTLCPNGLLAVSDLLNDEIYVVPTLPNSTPIPYTGLVGVGWVDGTPPYAKFQQPHGLAASQDGRIVVCDTGNNRLRLIDASTNTTTLYGTSTNIWTATCCTCDPTYYAGWVDGLSGNTSVSAAGRAPVSVTIAPSGTLFVTETYYDLIRAVTGSGLTPVNTAATAPGVVTGEAASITPTNAIFTGTVNPGGDVTGYYFEWGTNVNYGNYSPTNIISANLMTSNVVTYALPGILLSPNTTYHYQLVATNSLGVTLGGDTNFTTLGLMGSILTLPTTNGQVTAVSAQVEALVYPGGNVTSVDFQWGTTTNLGKTTSSTTLTANLNTVQTVTNYLSNLVSGTTYYYEAVAYNSEGTVYGSQLVFTTSNIPPPILTFSPSSGYFPECVTISVTSTVPAVFYTTDGSTPTPASAEATIIATNVTPLMTNYVETLQWCNPQADLTSLHLLGYASANSTIVLQGLPPATNLIGFPEPTDAGSGSTAYVPLVVQLQTNGVLKSLQFRVEVAPLNGAPAVSNITLQAVSTNDFVQFIGPAPGNLPVTYQTFAYTNPVNGAYGIVIATEPGSGLNIQGFAVPALLRVPIPQTALYGQSYSMTVLFPSGTSDGLAAEVGMTNLPAQDLTIMDKDYMSGDASPATGYNAGEFGNGELDNSDANTILYALVGIRKPYADSDAFNSMDVFPETNGLAKFGEGHLVYLDWQITLDRSLGLNTNNWIRWWTNGGVLTHSDDFTWAPDGAPVPLSDAPSTPSLRKLDQTSTPPGLVWFCQANITAGNEVALSAGNTCSMPVYANVLPGYSVWGMDFRAVVTPNGSAPAVGQVRFNAAPGMPPPAVLPGLSSNDIVCAWLLGDFEPPLENSTLIGYVTFQVPATASSGHSYSLNFLGTSGAPNGNTSYQMESFPATACIGTAALPTPSLTSDDWKIAFFGSVTNASAADNADADGDGALNWQEYLAGTNPTNAASCLQFTSAAFSGASVNGVAINWLTAPGRTYVLESSPTLENAAWTPVNTNIGDGNFYQWFTTNYSGNGSFYQIRLQQ
jgi:hypothetical protein